MWMENLLGLHKHLKPYKKNRHASQSTDFCALLAATRVIDTLGGYVGIIFMFPVDTAYLISFQQPYAVICNSSSSRSFFHP